MRKSTMKRRIGWVDGKEYQSTCYYENIGYTVMAPIVTGFNGISSIYYYTPC